MLRLLRIEWIKAKNSKSFRVLVTIWLIAFLSLPFGVKFLLDYLESTGFAGIEMLDIKPSDFPIFDFNDLWQNLAYLYKIITILLCFVIIVNVSSEFSNKTIRQNVIDGLSKREFILGKLLFIFTAATLATVLLTTIGFIAGFSLSPVTDARNIFMHFNFIGAYFLHLIYHLVFCMFLAILIKKSGLIIAFLIFYTYILESIATPIIMYSFKMPLLADFLPLNVSWNLIPRPIEKYALLPTQDFVGLADVSIALLYIGIFTTASYLLITKRDLQ